MMKKLNYRTLFKEAISLLAVIIFALAIRTFIFEPFYIPSGSMKDTLLEGDYVFSTKYNYGFSRYSLPLSPNLFKGRIFEKEAQRGDIVIFWPTGNAKFRYVKRLIGLPGDKIQIIRGVLYINDQPALKRYVGKYVDESGLTYNKYVETLPNGVSYNILNLSNDYLGFDLREQDSTKVFNVPKGMYFFMGDNRDDSKDSRAELGFVPSENLIGKAQIIFFSTSQTLWLEDAPLHQRILQIGRWLFSIRFNRVFKNLYHNE